MALRLNVWSMAFTFVLSGTLIAQVRPKQIPCFELNNANKSEWENKTFEAFCVETEGSLTMHYNSDGGIIGNDKVTLNPGATVSTSGGNVAAEILPSNDIAGVVWYQPNSTPGIVKQYEKLELGIDLSDHIEEQINTGSLNPYSEDDIALNVIFYRPQPYSYTHYQTTDSYTQPAFYYKYAERNADESGWNVADTDYDWRVRFAPDEIGTWTVVIHLYINAVLTSELKKITFDCVESNNKGPVVISRDNPRFLNYRDTDETYFPVGHNLCWGNWESRDSVMIVDKWLDELMMWGGNFTGFFLAPWSWSPEWEQLGNYESNQDVMSEMDRLIEKCENNHVYFNLTLLTHKRFRFEGGWLDWTRNPYHTQLGLQKPIEFFTDETAKKYFKQRIRYITARWGYSPNLAYYEIATEVDKMLEHARDVMQDEDSDHDFYDDATVREDFEDWLIEINDYIKSLKANNRNYTTVSYTSDIQSETDKYMEEVAPFDLVDITSLHSYNKNKAGNYVQRFQAFKRARDVFDNPVIMDESGVNQYIPLCTPMDYHNTIWAASFMGGMGTTNYWFWNEIHPKGYHTEVAGLSRFFRDELSLHKHEYEPGRWHNSNKISTNPEVPHNDASIEVFTLTREDKNKVLGWVHNNSYWWGSLYNSNNCIKLLVDDCSEEKDSLCIVKYIKDDPQPLTGAVGEEPRPEMKIQGLWPGVKYRIEWYYTNTTGAKAGWEQEDIANLAGTAKFVVPPTDDTHADWAFKIYQTLRKSGELISLEDNTDDSLSVLNHKITIIPNPTYDKKVLINLHEPDNCILQVYDVFGRLIDKHILSEGKTPYIFPENTTSGIYMMLVKQGEEVIYKQKQIVE